MRNPTLTIDRVTVEPGRGCLKLACDTVALLPFDPAREYAVTFTPLPTEAELKRREKVEAIISVYGDNAFDQLEAAGLLK